MKIFSSLFLENISYPLFAKYIYKQNFWSFVKDFERIQFESREALTERIENKIRKLIPYAYRNVEFYRNKFDELGISPDDIQKITDLQKLPIVTKTELKMNFPQNIIARNIPKERLLLSSTSGSTGEPFQFYLDTHSIDIRNAARLFFNKWAGIESGAKRLWVHGFLPGKKNINSKHNILAIFSIPNNLIRSFLLSTEHTSHLSVYSIEKNEFLNIFDYIQKVNPDYIESYTSAMVELANGLKDHDLKVAPNLKTIIATSDTLVLDQKKLIEEQFDCTVVNRYGSREFTGSVAQSCPENDNLLHVNTELVYLEVVSEDGKQVAPGESGRIVITDLNNYVMPFIRYDMNDYAVLGKECSCGRGFITLEKIEGRGIERIKLQNGKNISAPMLSSILRIGLGDNISNIRSYQAIQHTINKVEFRVVPESKLDPEVQNKLKIVLSTLFGDGVEINLNIIDEIEREASGKKLTIKSKC